ncbi:MAG: queuosine precursor transporter, partial [Candidatus Marinimicrobia bacterium]|nr:queuosine precursor transporter [Candidatus Neomarinimicrobiota bacterium]
GKHLWLRNNLSTWVSQLLDSVVFAFLAFAILPRLLMSPDQVLPMDVVIEIVITTYLLKILVAAIDTPFIYLSRFWKPKELTVIV